jgi:hypothetical protein
MATKKKTKKKSTRSKRTARGKATPTKKPTQKGRTPKKSAKRTTAPSRAAAREKVLKKTTSEKTVRVGNKETRKKSARRDTPVFSRETSGSHSGGQSGDLQGLSNVESADSESVDELIEEGNAFEAGVVSGVEDAGKRGEKEVRTHEVPEDDVPGEYLDKD